jgi:hypothetical protein
LGGVPEWLKGPVSKTGVPHRGTEGSNPSSSARACRQILGNVGQRVQAGGPGGLSTSATPTFLRTWPDSPGPRRLPGDCRHGLMGLLPPGKTRVPTSPTSPVIHRHKPTDAVRCSNGGHPPPRLHCQPPPSYAGNSQDNPAMNPSEVRIEFVRTRPEFVRSSSFVHGLSSFGRVRSYAA